VARIKILQLPETLDEIRPFALVIDQAQDLIDAIGELDHEPLAAFKAACGARAILVTPAAIDVT
jgi:hypothetical protein